MANELIIKNINNIDIDLLSTEDLVELKDCVVNTINLSKLNEDIAKACMNLSQVGPPSFMADVVYIAMDNQKRLDIIYMLMNNFNLFKNDVKNFKRNKNDCNDNIEYVYSFLGRTQSLIKSIIDFGDFKKNEYEENQKQVKLNAERVEKLQKEQQKRLKKGDN